MPETVLVNGNAYSLLKLLGKGKGGYSYLAQMADGQQVVVKQIHRVYPCAEGCPARNLPPPGAGHVPPAVPGAHQH